MRIEKSSEEGQKEEVKDNKSHKCTLCESIIHPIKEVKGAEKERFCCLGCYTVYEVLKQKGVSSYREDPLFKYALSAGILSGVDESTHKTQNPSSEPLETKKVLLHVEGMWCRQCSLVIEWLMKKVEGVISFKLDYSIDMAIVLYDPMKVSLGKILSEIKKIGYQGSEWGKEEKRGISRFFSLRLGVSLFSALNIMMFSYPGYLEFLGWNTDSYDHLFAWISALSAIPLFIFGVGPSLRPTLSSLKAKHLGMEALIVLGVSSSLILSGLNLYWGNSEVYFDSMAMIVVFVLLGKGLEAKIKLKAKNELWNFVHCFPQKVRKRAGDGSWEIESAKEVKEGETIWLLSGEKLAVDSEIVSGSGFFDESWISGESRPVKKERGDLIQAGATLKSGATELKAVAPYLNSTLYQVMDWVESGLMSKEEEVSLLDRVLTYFVPSVLFLGFISALLVLIGDGAPYLAMERLLSIWLISCPCAIGIALPIVESRTAKRLAEASFVLKNRACLSKLSKIESFCFDKTGTLTEGKFEVLSGFETMEKDELSKLMSLSLLSTHPVTQAVTHSLYKLDPTIKIQSLSHFEEIKGMGIKADLGSEKLFLGSAKWMRLLGFQVNESSSRETRVYFVDKRLTPYPILLGDQIRASTGMMIQLLKKQLSHEEIYLISGDRKEVVEQVAKECHIEKVFGSFGPSEKQEKLKEIKAKISPNALAFIGDGVNDAPAIASADVGIALNHFQGDASCSFQVSDLLFNSTDLTLLSKLKPIGLKARQISQQNIIWAFFYNLLALPLATLGYLSPIHASIAMILSSLSVIFNARRL